MSRQLIQTYYDAFNQADLDKFCSLLSSDVIHGINQSHREVGQAEFRIFMLDMFRYYEEKIRNLIIFDAGDNIHFAAKFIVDGVYKATAPNLPKANNQHYSLQAGAFFEIDNNKIKRVTNYYNLNEWLKQVS